MHDERSGTQYAKLLHEKGFDNVYLINGGIEGFLESHYDLVEGTDVPPQPKAKVEKKTVKKTGSIATSVIGAKSVMNSTTTSKMTTFSKR